jgi:hypothetical protein
MSAPSPLHQTQKLMRCRVLNRYSETGIRYVELDAFKLWEYLMTHKHGQQIDETVLCLWIDADDYRRSADVFDHSGQVEAVSKIIVDLFDAEHGFSQTTVRYARSSEAGQVIDILRSHIPPGLCESDDCQIETIDGYAVSQVPLPAGRGTLAGAED